MYQVRRQTGLLHPPLPKIELSKSNIDYRGVLIWNKIMSLEIRLDKSKSIFCEDFKKFIMDSVLHFDL